MSVCQCSNGHSCIAKSHQSSCFRKFHLDGCHLLVSRSFSSLVVVANRLLFCRHSIDRNSILELVYWLMVRDAYTLLAWDDIFSIKIDKIKIQSIDHVERFTLACWISFGFVQFSWVVQQCRFDILVFQSILFELSSTRRIRFNLISHLDHPRHRSFYSQWSWNVTKMIRAHAMNNLSTFRLSSVWH